MFGSVRGGHVRRTLEALNYNTNENQAVKQPALIQSYIIACISNVYFFWIKLNARQLKIQMPKLFRNIIFALRFF